MSYLPPPPPFEIDAVANHPRRDWRALTASEQAEIDAYRCHEVDLDALVSVRARKFVERHCR